MRTKIDPTQECRVRMRTSVAPARLLAVLSLLGVLGACKTTRPATVEQEKQEERRIMQPFSRGGLVGCGELIIEMTPNFYPYVSQPARDSKLHGHKEEQFDGYVEKTWFNKLGDFKGRFTVVVGPEPDPLADAPGPQDATGRATGGVAQAPGSLQGRQAPRPPSEPPEPARFMVIHKIVHRIYLVEREMTLNVIADGRPMFLQERAATEPVELLEYQARDGKVEIRRAPQD